MAADELLRDPVGNCFVGRSVIVWVQTASRFGSVHRSPLDFTDAPALATLFPLPMVKALQPPFDLLHDLSGVQAVDERAFHWVQGFMEQTLDDLAARTRRFAVVRPSGLAGAAVTGIFHEWVTPRFDAKLCTRRSEAHAWLGIEPGEQAEIDTLHDSLTQPELIRKLHDALAADLQDATLDRIAGALATSGRSLQRQLAQHGTSFRDELDRARIRAAEAMLLETSAKIEAIASDVGFRSPAAFTAMFRRVNGEVPGAFRNRVVEKRASSS